MVSHFTVLISDQELLSPKLEFELHLFTRSLVGVNAPSAEPKMVSLQQFLK